MLYGREKLEDNSGAFYYIFQGIACEKGECEPNAMVVDYIAGMTDDYFVDLYRHLFPGSKYDVKYVGYFEGGSLSS